MKGRRGGSNVGWGTIRLLITPLPTPPPPPGGFFDRPKFPAGTLLGAADDLGYYTGNFFILFFPFFLSFFFLKGEGAGRGERRLLILMVSQASWLDECTLISGVTTVGGDVAKSLTASSSSPSSSNPKPDFRCRHKKCARTLAAQKGCVLQLYCSWLSLVKVVRNFENFTLTKKQKRNHDKKKN